MGALKQSKQRVGRWGEQLAATFLGEKGYTILECNVSTPYGEIDLVARQDFAGAGALQPASATVFVEVKTRRSQTFGLPEQAITRRKQEHMLAAAAAYMQQHPELPQDWRLDVVAVQALGNEAPQIVHYENVFSA